jgi:hypothetical protein
MLHHDTKSIILTETTMVTILTLTLPSLSVDRFGATLQTPYYEPNSYIDKREIMNNIQAELSTKNLLERQENETFINFKFPTFYLCFDYESHN